MYRMSQLRRNVKIVLAQEEELQLTYPHAKDFLEYLRSQPQVGVIMVTVCIYRVKQESLANARHLKHQSSKTLLTICGCLCRAQILIVALVGCLCSL